MKLKFSSMPLLINSIQSTLFQKKITPNLHSSFPLLLFYSFFSFTLTCQGQHYSLLKTISIKAPMAISTDRYDNIFYADENGSIFCYDTNGIKLNEYSPQRVARVWNIEAWKSVKIFTFYRELQEYSLFNRFLVPTAEQFKIANTDNLIGFARSATLSFDESIWLFDEQDFSLKKYNSEQQQVIVNTPLSLILESNEYNINYMREYENILFVNDTNSGILVFDNLGNYKKKIPYSGLNYFGFLNEEMYFLKNNKLFFFHLYNFLERSIDLPDVKGKILFVLCSSKHLTIFTSKELYFFKILK